VILPDHLTEEVDYSRVISLNIDRGALGEYLIDRVKKLGVSVKTGTKVVDVTQPHSN
jgi:flavin-dependent dehydrogenase